jgi:hypothetical protein
VIEAARQAAVAVGDTFLEAELDRVAIDRAELERRRVTIRSSWSVIHPQ